MFYIKCNQFQSLIDATILRARELGYDVDFDTYIEKRGLYLDTDKRRLQMPTDEEIDEKTIQ